MPGKRLVLVSLLGLWLTGCQSNPIQTVNGQQVYHAKLGNFTVNVPHLVKPGARMIEGGGADTANVNFSDDAGTLLRVESFKMTPKQKEAFSGEHTQQTLNSFFDDILMKQEFIAASPDAKVLYRNSVETAAGKALFAVVVIPGGSTLMDVTPDKAPKRLDSVRGVLLFPQHDFLYVVSNQEWPEATAQKDVEKRTDALLQDLKQTVAGMTFH